MDRRYLPTVPHPAAITNGYDTSAAQHYSASHKSDFKSSQQSSSHQSSTAKSASSAVSSSLRQSSNQQSSNQQSSNQQSSSLQRSAEPAAAEKRPLKPYGGKAGGGGGSQSRSRSATKELEIPPDDSLMHAPVFDDKMAATLSVRDGEALALRCQVHGDPDPKIVWSKNGDVLASSDVVDLKYRQGVASLQIGEVFPEDEGLYECRAYNSMGEVTTTCQVTVTAMESAPKRGEAGGEPPRVVEHIKSDVVKDGDAVTLTCRLSGTSKFDVVWLHNDKEIKPSKDFEYDSAGDLYTLKIAEIFPEDAGAYTCEAFNDAGESFSSCTLVVLVPNEERKQPAFKTFPASATIQEGESAKFSLALEKSATKVTWCKDGKPLEDSGTHLKITGEKTKHQLEILACVPTDVGQYSVKCQSKKGETCANFSLNVVAKLQE